MPELTLTPHPRLYVSADDLARLKTPPALPYLVEAACSVEQDAARFVDMPPLTYSRNKHNAHLTRAREVQQRVLTLVARWAQSGEARYREAALRYVEMIGEWEYWSWITWRRGDPAPDAIFDLSYGENSATLALAYDWLYDTLSDAEKRLFLDIAQARSFRSGLKNALPGASHWVGRRDSNWNTVCGGGLGMLCLALYEEAPEARELLPRVEASVASYFEYLDETSGAWPEGIGYWNYGMRYGFTYLLSYERATGRAHPLMARQGVVDTLAFPLDFSPHGLPCSFGDSNHWSPLPFHHRAAARLGRDDVVRALEAHLKEHSISPEGRWPNAAEWLLLHPGVAAGAALQAPQRRVKLYEGLDWAVLSDPTCDPPVHVTIRGGTTQVPHGHRDLLSFHLVVGREHLIASLGPSEYLDTTFSPRRDELFEMAPFSKNTILINGVGVAPGSELDATDRVDLDGAQGVRMEATTAMGEMYDGPAARFCGRWVLLLEGGAVLIVDRVHLTQVGRIESRMHTWAKVELDEAGALLRGEQEALRVCYACSVPAILRTATTAPTTPTDPPAGVLRWCSEDQVMGATMATLLVPGGGEAGVRVSEDGERVRAAIDGSETDLAGFRKT